MIKVFEKEISATFLPKSLFSIAAGFAAWAKVQKLHGYHLSSTCKYPYCGGMTTEQSATFYVFNEMFQNAFKAEAERYATTGGDDLGVLSDMYNAWGEANHLQLGCALEMLHEDDNTVLTQVTLQWFSHIWEYSEDREVEQEQENSNV